MNSSGGGGASGIGGSSSNGGGGGGSGVGAISVLNTLNHDGYAPIHLLAMASSSSAAAIELMRELLYVKHVRLNIQDRRAGMSALHHVCGAEACEASRRLGANLDMCMLLVRDERVDLNARGYNGCTPLHVAVANKNYLIVCLLVSVGADLNAPSDVAWHHDAAVLAQSAAAAEKRNELLKRAIEYYYTHYARSGTPPPNADAGDRGDHLLAAMSDAKEASDAPSDATGHDDDDEVKISQEIKRIYERLERRQAVNLSTTTTTTTTAAGAAVTSSDSVITSSSSSSLSASSSLHHYCDVIYYANGDEWMLEIFANRRGVSRRLLEKIVCFERCRRRLGATSFTTKNNNNNNGDKNSHHHNNNECCNDAAATATCKLMVSDVMRTASSKLDDLIRNKSLGEVKMSQQATVDNEDYDSIRPKVVF